MWIYRPSAIALGLAGVVAAMSSLSPPANGAITTGALIPAVNEFQSPSWARLPSPSVYNRSPHCSLTVEVPQCTVAVASQPPRDANKPRTLPQQCLLARRGAPRHRNVRRTTVRLQLQALLVLATALLLPRRCQGRGLPGEPPPPGGRPLARAVHRSQMGQRRYRLGVWQISTVVPRLRPRSLLKRVVHPKLGWQRHSCGYRTWP
jgi:hypothetical protein